MTRIESTGRSSAPAETPASEEAQPTEAPEAFEHVIDQKTETGKTSSKASNEADSKTPEVPDTARGTDQGVTRRHGGRSQDSGAGGSEGQSSRTETSSPEAPPPRPIPGDVVIPQILTTVPPEVQAPTARSLSPETALLIQGIVDRIVDAVQVRLDARGAAEVHMELNMGRLGPMMVELHRTPEGQLRIGFQTTTVDAQGLLTGHVSELTQRLEARGLTLQEVTVRMPDQPEFRWEPPTSPPLMASPEPSSRSPYQQGESDRGRRDRTSSEEVSEEDR